MGGKVVPGLFDPPESMRPTLVGDRWAVVAGHPLPCQVAADVLARGGNAVDAGVAAGLATNVVQVDMCSFGGIAPILVRPAGSAEVYDVAGVGRWSRTVSLEKMRDRYGAALPLGEAPFIVPGAPSAWLTALEQFGTWRFRDVVAPAAELARDGFPLDLRTARSMQIMSAGFSRWDSSRRVLCPLGREPRAGDRLIQADLAKLLTELSDADSAADRVDGIRQVHDAFYRGRPAARLASAVTECGGFLDVPDLADYRAQVSLAPRIRFAGRWVHCTGLSTQGAVALQAAGILERRGALQLTPGSGRYLHEVVEALKLAFSQREGLYGDPDFTGLRWQDLVDGQHLDRLAAGVTDTANSWPPSAALSARGGTTALVVADSGGAVFACTPSDTADGGPIVDGLGILCSPRGVQSRLVAGHPNVLAPGKRPCVTPASLITLPVSGDDLPEALSCPGGDVIVQAMLQVLAGRSAGQFTAQQAVEAPRIAAFDFPSGFHPHPSADKVVFAEDRLPSASLEDLRRRGHNVDTWPGLEFDAGSVQLIAAGAGSDGSRQWLAGADPRRSAYAFAR